LNQVKKSYNDVAADGTISLPQIETIAEILGLDIRVCTKEGDERIMIFPKFDFDNARSGHPGLIKITDAHCCSDPIYMHYESKIEANGHFVLINKMNAYCTQFKCDLCKIRWYQNSGGSRYQLYQKHMEKHKQGKNPTETELKFIDNKFVEPRQYAFEQHLNINHSHKCYITFDFEAITAKYQNASHANVTTKHEPVAFVSKFTNMYSNEPEFECDKEFCGKDAHVQFVDYLTELHDKLKTFMLKQLWKQYGKAINGLKESLCSCDPNIFHRNTCIKKPGHIERAKRLGFVGCCKVRETHAKGHNGVAENMDIVYDMYNEQISSEMTKDIRFAIQAFLPKAKKCKFQMVLDALKRQYLNIPVYGFNSGKYDMTFVIKAMGRTKYPIA